MYAYKFFLCLLKSWKGVEKSQGDIRFACKFEWVYALMYIFERYIWSKQACLSAYLSRTHWATKIIKTKGSDKIR